jgi:signal transduction histidine kinase
LTRTEETSEINEMLKLSRVEMAQREKMVAIGQMATGIAHEIGNPLASLSSVAQYLQRKADDPDQIEMLKTMSQQIERISMILKRMLSLSRPATSEYRWADVNTLIENTVSLVQFDRRAKSVEIKNEVNHDLPMVWLNPLHFEQVLLNIFLNGLDAMAAQKDQSHQLEITRNHEDRFIVIRVRDDGIGMEPEICRRAFESFFTTKELGKGTGLGLFISYNLVSELDGTIELDSEPGKGTTVTIKIPIRPKNDLISIDEVNEGLVKES